MKKPTKAEVAALVTPPDVITRILELTDHEYRILSAAVGPNDVPALAILAKARPLTDVERLNLLRNGGRR